MTHRWANTKSKIHFLADGKAVKAGTGLENHFKEGCALYCKDLKSVRVTLLEHMNVTEEGLTSAIHQAGPGCRCHQCEKLKSMEDKWICRLGTFHGNFGLNERDEVRRRARGSYWNKLEVQGVVIVPRNGWVPRGGPSCCNCNICGRACFMKLRLGSHIL